MLALLTFCLFGQNPKVIELPCPSKSTEALRDSGWSWSGMGGVIPYSVPDTGAYLPTAAHLVSGRDGTHFWFTAPNFDSYQYDSLVIYLWGSADSVNVFAVYPARSNPNYRVIRGKPVSRLSGDTVRVSLKLGEEGAAPPLTRGRLKGFILHIMSYSYGNFKVSNTHFFKKGE